MMRKSRRTHERLSIPVHMPFGIGDSLSGWADEDAGVPCSLACTESRWSIGLTVSADAVAGQLNW
jgi:hypothetical protein